jgi:hypothetical protein
MGRWKSSVHRYDSIKKTFTSLDHIGRLMPRCRNILISGESFSPIRDDLARGVGYASKNKPNTSKLTINRFNSQQDWRSFAVGIWRRRIRGEVDHFT